MTVWTWTVTVDRRPEVVFAYLTDMSRHGEWSPRPYRIEPVDGDGTAMVGARFRSVGSIPGDKNHENDVEITRVDPPTHFSLTAYEKGEPFKHDFVLTPAGAGTKVERTVASPLPTGLLRVFYPVIWPLVIRPGVQRDLQNFKAKCEASTPPG
jgi:uncharacterized protein YndB with AHSA1/START domain